MKILRNANNLIEILENGQVILRIIKSSLSQEELNRLLNSDEYEIQNYDIDIQFDASEDRDWMKPLIGE